MLVEALRDLLIGGVEAKREVGRQHRGRMTLRGVVPIGHCAGAGAILRRPLIGAGRALGQLPLIAEEVREELVAPFGRRRGPGDLEAAGDRIAPLATAVARLPAEALLLDARALGLGTDELRIACTMRLAETVAAGDERDGLLVIHRHAREGLADVLRGGDRI